MCKDHAASQMMSCAFVFRLQPKREISRVCCLVHVFRSALCYLLYVSLPLSFFLVTVIVFYSLTVTMAEKEATVYIVDVGQSMGVCRHGRMVTDLQWSMRYVWDRVTATVLLLAQTGSHTLADNGSAGGYGAEDGYGWGGWSKDRR